MSHFAVLVIGPHVAQQLAPFHEFECTGEDDEFVQDLDVTEEKRAEYESARQPMVRLADGTEHSRYNNQFYVKSGEGFHARTDFVLPEGATEYEIQLKDTMSFAHWLREEEQIAQKTDSAVADGDKDPCKYGFFEADADDNVIRVINRTNPNKKWDWWVIGGRWSGFFQVKGEIGEALRHRRALTSQCLPLPDSLNQKLEGIEMGRRSLLDRSEPKPICSVDAARKCQIDFDQMRNAAGNEAAERYDAFYAIVGEGAAWISWEDVRKAHTNAEGSTDLDKAREQYGEQPAIKALRDSKDDRFSFFFEPDSMRCTREEYIQRARNSAISTYAVVKDGQWYARGEMGWFGMSSDDMSREEWDTQFTGLLDSLPDDTQLTVVDCHI